MKASEAQLELPIRVAAGGLTVAGLAICHTVALSEGMIFFVLPMICATLVLLTRAQGGLIGSGVGVVTGLSLAIALTAQTAAPHVNQLAFTMIAVTITGLLGYVGGCWHGSMIGRPSDQASGSANPVDAESARQRPEAPADRSDEPGPCSPAAVAGVSADFCAWLDDENVSWAAFDQFVRGALRARLGAACVRCFHVGRDFLLNPLTENILQQADSTLDDRIAAATPSIPSSLLQRLVADHGVYIAAGRSRAVGERGDLAELAERSGPWNWLFPIRDRDRVCGLVAIGRFESGRPSQARAAEEPSPETAAALAAVLSIAWRHVRNTHALRRGLQRDGQSGVLNRSELLARVDRAVAASARDGEPLMMMGIVVEGLRGLDDAGDFAGRDDLIARLGDALCGKVRADDVVGRFADDRFIIVFRRLEIRLGRMIAEKLVQTLKAELIRREEADCDRSAAAENIFIRAGLVGAGPACANRSKVLSRTLGLLEQARADGIELAIDTPADDAAVDEPGSSASAAVRSQVKA